MLKPEFRSKRTYCITVGDSALISERICLLEAKEIRNFIQIDSRMGERCGSLLSSGDRWTLFVGEPRKVWKGFLEWIELFEFLTRLLRHLWIHLTPLECWVILYWQLFRILLEKSFETDRCRLFIHFVMSTRFLIMHSYMLLFYFIKISNTWY